MVMRGLYIGNKSSTIPYNNEIVGVMAQVTELGMKRSTTCPCSTLEKVLMAFGEEDLCLGTALLPPIIQVIMVYNLVFIVMVIIEVGRGLTTANFLHTTMVN